MDVATGRPLVVTAIVAGMSLGGGAGYSRLGKARAGNESHPHNAARIQVLPPIREVV
jgi:hypothetical protein